jgi:hypothetical protein
MSILYAQLIAIFNVAMSILLIYESAQPGANFFRGKAVSFGVPYVSLTIALNIIVTSLIVIRLLSLRKRVRALLGPKHADMYTSIAAIVIESATPFTLLGIAYLITYQRHSNVSLAFVQVWGDFCVSATLLPRVLLPSNGEMLINDPCSQALSPQFIILRVAMGKGWTKGTTARVSTNLSFNHDHTHSEPDSTEGKVSTTRHGSGEKVHHYDGTQYSEAV